MVLQITLNFIKTKTLKELLALAQSQAGWKISEVLLIIDATKTLRQSHQKPLIPTFNFVSGTIFKLNSQKRPNAISRSKIKYNKYPSKCITELTRK